MRLASALALLGVAGVAVVPEGRSKKVSVEHPTDEFSVELELDTANPQNVVRRVYPRLDAVLKARGS